MHGVDVSGSVQLQDPDVVAAAEFAAAAHAGQWRKTGEPYVAHCIETALIVERNLPAWRQDSRYRPRARRPAQGGCRSKAACAAGHVRATFDRGCGVRTGGGLWVLTGGAGAPSQAQRCGDSGAAARRVGRHGGAGAGAGAAFRAQGGAAGRGGAARRSAAGWMAVAQAHAWACTAAAGTTAAIFALLRVSG